MGCLWYECNFFGAWSANGYGVLRPGLKTGLENRVVKNWSEVGSRFGKPGGTSPTDNDNKKLYLQDLTSTYSIAKAIYNYVLRKTTKI